VIAPGRDHHLARRYLTTARRDAKSADVVGRHARDVGAERHGRADDLRVARDPGRDLVAAHEPVRIAAVVRPTGQRRRPVRGDERELVPAVPPAAAERVAALDDDVLTARLGQEVGHRQAGVAGADDQDVDVAGQRGIGHGCVHPD
jgi:hypothetical protein